MRNRKGVGVAGLLGVAGLWAASLAAPDATRAQSQSPACGSMPIPDPGCSISQCVAGRWMQKCGDELRTVCGPRPIPAAGCWIEACVDGKWLGHCAMDDLAACGIRPIPKLGCVIGRCKNRRWEQICEDSLAGGECGPKPDYPPVGCRIGECADGNWKLLCNEPIPFPPYD